MGSGNVKIDADKLHIGPQIVCSSTQNVDTKINIHCCKCKISEKVNLTLTCNNNEKCLLKEPYWFGDCICEWNTNVNMQLYIQINSSSSVCFDLYQFGLLNNNRCDIGTWELKRYR